MVSRLAMAAFCFAACACVADGAGYSVASLLAESGARDGARVTVRGRLRVQEHGLVNLYSPNRQQCIGLLVTDRDRPRYREREGRIVTVTGQLHAQGCGREGLCDEHLCGPAILRDLELL